MGRGPGPGGRRGCTRVPNPHAIEIPRWFSESFLDFREEVRDAAREGKRVMVYFGQDGCPYCKALMTVDAMRARGETMDLLK